MLARAQPVEVVEHLEGRRIPVGPVRRLGRAGAAGRRASAAATGTAAARRAGQAEIDEGARGNSCPAAVLAARMCASISLGGACARAAVPSNMADKCGNHDWMCASLVPPCHMSRMCGSSRQTHGFRRQDVAVPVNGAKKTGSSADRLRSSAAAARPRDRPTASSLVSTKAPDFLEQLISKHHARMAFGQYAQNLEFPMREMQIAARRPSRSPFGNRSSHRQSLCPNCRLHTA